MTGAAGVLHATGPTHRPYVPPNAAPLSELPTSTVRVLADDGETVAATDEARVHSARAEAARMAKQLRVEEAQRACQRRVAQRKVSSLKRPSAPQVTTGKKDMYVGTHGARTSSMPRQCRGGAGPWKFFPCPAEMLCPDRVSGDSSESRMKSVGLAELISNAHACRREAFQRLSSLDTDVHRPSDHSVASSTPPAVVVAEAQVVGAPIVVQVVDEASNIALNSEHEQSCASRLEDDTIAIALKPPLQRVCFDVGPTSADQNPNEDATPSSALLELEAAQPTGPNLMDDDNDMGTDFIDARAHNVGHAVQTFPQGDNPADVPGDVEQDSQASVTCRSCGNTGFDVFGNPCVCKLVDGDEIVETLTWQEDGGCFGQKIEEFESQETCGKCGNTGVNSFGYPCSCICPDEDECVNDNDLPQLPVTQAMPSSVKAAMERAEAAARCFDNEDVFAETRPLAAAPHGLQARAVSSAWPSEPRILCSNDAACAEASADSSWANSDTAASGERHASDGNPDVKHTDGERGNGSGSSSASDRAMRYTSGLLSLLVRAYAKRGRPPPALCACVACPSGAAPSITADGNLVQSPLWEAWVQRVSSTQSHARNCEFSEGLPRLQRQVLTLFQMAKEG